MSLLLPQGPEKHCHPVGFVLRIGLGVFWLYVGGEKFFRMESFIQDVENYRLVSGVTLLMVAYGVPALEFVCGLALIWGRKYQASLALTLVMLLMFIAGIASAWARGLEIHCGCFSSQAGQTSNYPLHLIGNMVLIGLSLFLMLEKVLLKRLKPPEQS